MGKKSGLQRVRRQRVFDPLVVPIGQSPQRLIIDGLVLAHFADNQQINKDSHEAGGQLFAQLSGDCVVISSASGPRSSDRRSRYLYLPNRREEQREIDTMHLKGLHFIGDWHTHAEPAPQPSSSDIQSIQDAVVHSRHHLFGFIMIVVGNADLPAGLHVSFNSACGHFQLFPLPSAS